ncbi:hypothetical protein R3I94_006344 [Phoxinus phoxinus]|jgi:hypothetical protein
MNAE